MSDSPGKRIIHCQHHDYIYYPVLWNINGTEYQPGYYDEDGNRYDNVAFTENGSTTIELECEYCGSKAKYKWEEGAIPKCMNCGAPMTVQNVYTDTVLENNASGINSYSENNNVRKPKKKKKLLWIVAILAVLAFIGSEKDTPENNYISGGTSNYSQTVNSFPVSDTIYLKKTGNGIYEISEASDFSKILYWDNYEECYYDEVSAVWLWYNDEVNPPVWQYWYDNISSNYGDYGWMECEGNAWYIETSYGKWEKYNGNTSVLWHIRNGFDK